MHETHDSPAVLGVYSLRLTKELGSGVTMVDRQNVTYWYVRQLSPERAEVQPLTDQGLPSGMTRMLPMMEVLRGYTPEPFYYTDHRVSVLESLAAKVQDSQGVAFLAALDGPELACLKAILCREPSLPGPSNPGFDQACEFLSDEVRRVLQALLCRCPVAKFEHRARCNSHGVALRKDKCFDESLGYFAKALEIEDNDENVHFNIARVHFDRGDYDQCALALEKALGINPGFVEAGKFVRYIGKKTGQAANA